jgi:hypothetical protein
MIGENKRSEVMVFPERRGLRDKHRSSTGSAERREMGESKSSFQSE